MTTINIMHDTDKLIYVLSNKFPQMHTSMLSHTKTVSPTDCSSTETLILSFAPISEDEDNLPDFAQVRNSLFNYFSLPCNLTDPNHKLIYTTNEWLTLFTEVNQKQEYTDNEGNHCTCPDVYQYTNIILTDLTIHIIITNPAL